MNQPGNFSQRTGFAPQDVPITVHTEAPAWLRDLVVTLSFEAGIGANDMRDLACTLLLESPNPNNWSPGNVEWEVRSLLQNAEWYHIYDFVEVITERLENCHAPLRLRVFSEKLNEAFRRKGIGWQLVDGRIETRGPESFETVVRDAITAMRDSGRSVAQTELHEALHDLSRRPDPDITGAIQHSMAALECVARDVTSDPKPTLGEWLKKHRGEIPPPLDVAVDKIWGYTSEQGRHLREDQAPVWEEAQLVVGLASVLISYLSQKFAGPNP